MVVLQECLNMFWGVTIDGGKRYSQTVEHPFHLSMAALEYNPIGCHDDKTKHVQVMIQHESTEFLLCTLTHSHLLQQPLDLDFSEGEEVTFFLNGSGIVHLTGSLTEGSFADDYDDNDVDSDSDVPELQAVDDDDDDDEEDLDWEPTPAGSKRKYIENSGKKNKKLKITDIGEEEEDDEYDSSFIDDSHIDGSDEEKEEMNDEFDSEELDEENLEIVKKNGQIVSPKRKIPNMKGDADSLVANVKHKENKQKSSQDISLVQQRGEINEQLLQKSTDETTGEKKKRKKKKKKKKKKKNEDDDKQKQTVDPPENLAPSSPLPKKRVVAGGTIVEDIKVGHGPDAKPGKMVSVYFVGTLAKNNVRFDSCQGGKPFRFRLGQGEVIKGWDTGVIGMKVGGKRRITVPPSQGYGNSRQGTIPPGSTLVFDVELKAAS